MTTSRLELLHAEALRLDESDPAPKRDAFELPHNDKGTLAYLTGNSLGPLPKQTRNELATELDDWSRLAVDAHFEGSHPWYDAHLALADPGARLVGGHAHEVVWMNGLTVNLHLLLASFWRPQGNRTKILMDAPAFPSDTYAIKSHLRQRGFDPDEHLIIVNSGTEEPTAPETLEAAIAAAGDTLALGMIAGVNFLTGQVHPIARITKALHNVGALAGWDLAHAAGNIHLQLHEDQVDFAAWCSYKYLNGGPGGLSGVFIHERNAQDTSRPRFGGWWGNDPSTRFKMHQIPDFHPVPTADAWQLSNPPILALAPLRSALALFDEVGMPKLRARSQRLTGWLRKQLPHWVEVMTPERAQGAQLSLRVDQADVVQQFLQQEGVVCDVRKPNIIRAAPAPLYNSYEDAFRLVRALTMAHESGSTA